LILAEDAPQEQFRKQFGPSYKLADEKAGMEEEEVDEMETEEDAVQATVEYRHWRTMAKANNVILQVINEVVSLIQMDDEDEYEEIEDDGEEETKAEESSAVNTGAQELVL
jgi:hypothetical protein